MTFVRRAAALFAGVSICVGVLAIGGCAPMKKSDASVMPPVPTVDAIEALKAHYAAAGNLVGRVEAVNSAEMIAAVSGIDPAAAGNENAVFTYVDVAGDQFVNNGMLTQKAPTPSGYLVISYDPQGQRAPQVGDLVVRRK